MEIVSLFASYLLCVVSDSFFPLRKLFHGNKVFILYKHEGQPSFRKRWSTNSVEAPALLVLFDERGLTQVCRWGVRGACERKVHLS